MEYLTQINQSLKSINEDGIKYYNVFSDCPDLLHGIPLFSVFGEVKKYSFGTINEMEIGTFSKFGNNAYRTSVQSDFLNNVNSATGCCLRFKTTASQIVFRVHLKRRWDYLRMTLWCSSGFDVYIRQENEVEWKHKTVFGPNTGYNMFAESIGLPENVECMIFLPLYNQIYELYIGSRAELQPIRDYRNPVPIAFYGNSITQGAAASRSGNAFCNIVSRQLDSAIVNYSVSSGCHGQISVAKTIGEINISAMVIDYSRNAYSAQHFEQTHEKFYLELRKYHPTIPVIFLTTVFTNFQKSYKSFDQVIYQTYEKAKQRGENVYIINVMELLQNFGFDVVTVDGAHLNDAGMLIVADAITDIIRFSQGWE